MFGHLAATWKFRHFLLSLVRLDLRQRYRRSVLGIGWSLLNPIAMTVVFTVVFSNLLGGGDPVGYAASVLAGMAVWGFLRDSALAGCRCFQENEAYIRQSPIPYTVYTLRTVLGQAVHSMIAVGVVAALVAAYQADPLALLRLGLAAPGLVMALLVAWAVATLAALATTFFHDTAHLMEVAAQLLFFLTPIMYPRKLLDDKGMGWVVDINPGSWLLDVTRGPLLTGQLPGADVYLTCAALTAALILLAAGAVGWLEKRVIFHL